KVFDANPATKSKYCSKECADIARSKKTERTCKHCLAVFMASRAMVKNGWAKYCSKSCKDKALRGIDHHSWKEKTKGRCEFCYELFTEHPSHAGRKKYCSKQCRRKAVLQRTLIPCGICGKQINNHGDKRRKYCSPKCAYKALSGNGNHNWKGGDRRNS